MRRSGRGMVEREVATSRLVSARQRRPEQGDVDTHFLQLDGDLRVARQTVTQREDCREVRVLWALALLTLARNESDAGNDGLDWPSATA